MQLAQAVRVTRGTLYISAQSALSFAVGLIFYMIVARILPREDIGALSALTFVYVTVPILAQLALPVAATKYISEYLGRGEVDKAAAVASTVKKLVVGLSLVVLAVMLLLSGWFSVLLWGNVTGAVIFITISVAAFFAAVRTVYLCLLQGLQRFGKYAITGSAAFMLSRVMGVILVFFGYSLTGVAMGWLIGEIIGLGMTVLAFHGGLPKPTNKFELKMLFNFSLPLFVLLLVTTVSDWADRMLFLALTHDLPSLGVYDLAVRGATTLSIIWMAFATTVLPMLSELYGQKGKDAITGALKSSLRYLTYLIIPAGFGLAAISRTAMALLFGRGYTIGSLPLAILALASVFLSIGTILGSALQALGETRVFIKVGLASLAADVMVIVFSVPILGVLGATAARVTLWLVLFTLTYSALRRVVQVEFDKEALWKGTLASLIMTIPLLSFETVYANFSPILCAVIEIAAGVTTYSIALFSLRALHKQDFELFQQMAPASTRKFLNCFERFFTH